jgi:hypothetical protein
MVKTFTFDDVADTFNEVANEVAPFDWRNFLMARLNSTDFHAPLGGIERSGSASQAQTCNARDKLRV